MSCDPWERGGSTCHWMSRPIPPPSPVPAGPPTAYGIVTSTASEAAGATASTVSHLTTAAASNTRTVMKSVSSKIEGHVPDRVQHAVDNWPLVVAGIVLSSVLVFCCLACCLARLLCRCWRRVQAASRRRGVARCLARLLCRCCGAAASRRRGVARRERQIDSERLTPGLPAQGRGGKPGARVAPEKGNDPPRRAIRNIKMILQPPRAAWSLVPSEEDEH